MRKKAVKVNHRQFYRAVNMLKRHKERFCEERPGLVRGAAMLSELCGFTISRSTMAEIKDTAHIEWVAKTDTAKKGLRPCLATIAVAVERLYVKLGEATPSDLAACTVRLTRRAAREADGADETDDGDEADETDSDE